MIIVAVTRPDAASAGERKLPIELFISVSSVPTAFDSNRIFFPLRATRFTDAQIAPSSYTSFCVRSRHHAVRRSVPGGQRNVVGELP
jgi:hypothetical protein